MGTTFAHTGAKMKSPDRLGRVSGLNSTQNDDRGAILQPVIEPIGYSIEGKTASFVAEKKASPSR